MANKEGGCKLLVCPYCPPKRIRARRTACYKIKRSVKDNLIFSCIACRKTFKIPFDGHYVIRDEKIKVIERDDMY